MVCQMNTNSLLYSEQVSLKHIGYLMQYLMGEFYCSGYLAEYTILDMDFSLQGADFERIPLRK